MNYVRRSTFAATGYVLIAASSVPISEGGAGEDDGEGDGDGEGCPMNDSAFLAGPATPDADLLILAAVVGLFGLAALLQKRSAGSRP